MEVFEIDPKEVYYLFFGSIIPSLLALVVGIHLCKLISSNRIKNFQVNLSGIRASDNTCGLHLNIAAFALFPSIIIFYQEGTKIRLHLYSSFYVQVENLPLIIFYITILLACSLYIIVRISSCIDYSKNTWHRLPLSFVINSLGGASLALTLFFLAAGVHSVIATA